MNDFVVAGRYRLGRRIGIGGMGRVWLAVDEVLRRDVAVKEVLLPEGLTDDDAAELRMRTLREARAAARLSHPNVIQIFDVIYAEQRPWIVMEYVPSRSLAQVLKDDGPMSPEAAARIGLPILAALVAAHEAGVLHRDVKPGNVLLGADDRVVLTDFGLATFDDVGSALTASGVVHGSPQFIAPERALDGTSTSAADMWSLGATLYAAVEGRAPYARASSYATLTALATAPPDPPRHAGALKPLLGGLLRRNPDNRMGPDEVRSWLEQVVGPTTPVVIPRQRGRNDPSPVSPAPRTAQNDQQSSRGSHSIRNRRPFGDTGSRRKPSAQGRGGAPSPSGSVPGAPSSGGPRSDMPIAGSTPPDSSSGSRKTSGSQASFTHPPVNDSHDTDHEMDLAWKLDASAGLFGDRSSDSGRSRTTDRAIQRRAARRRRIVGIAIALVVVLAGAAGGYAIKQSRHSAHASTFVPPSSSPATSSAQQVVGPTTGGNPAAVTFPCSAIPLADEEKFPPVPTQPASKADGYPALDLPSSFQWTTFPHGVIGVDPAGWFQASGTDDNCFYDPTSSHVFGVRIWSVANSNPLAVLQGLRAALQKKRPPLKTLSIGPDQFRSTAANWEYTYVVAAHGNTPAVTMHTGVHLNIHGDEAIADSWTTPSSDWSNFSTLYSIVCSAFDLAIIQQQ